MRSLLLLLCLGLAAACNDPIAASADGSAALPEDASLGTADTGPSSLDAAVAGPDAGEAGPDAAGLDDAGLEACGAAFCSSGTTCDLCLPTPQCVSSTPVDRSWIQWPLPSNAPPSSSYALTTNIVTDNLTGLRWQRNSRSDDLTLTEARDYCASLSVDGYTCGWRLPTRVELLSIVNYANDPRSTPVNAVDPTAFPNIVNGSYWTASAPGGASDKAFILDFSDGRLGYCYVATCKAMVVCVH